MTKSISLLILLTFSFLSHANGFSGFKSQVCDSALAYGRSPQSAQEAAAQINTTLALQIYLSLSTPSYFTSHLQAIEAVRQIQTYFAFQVYLTLRTASYHLSHDQALFAAITLSSQRDFQLYLHLLVTGISPEDALRMAARDR